MWCQKTVGFSIPRTNPTRTLDSLGTECRPGVGGWVAKTTTTTIPYVNPDAMVHVLLTLNEPLLQRRRCTWSPRSVPHHKGVVRADSCVRKILCTIRYTYDTVVCGISITPNKQFHEKTVRRSNEQSRFVLIPMTRYIHDTMAVFLFT